MEAQFGPPIRMADGLKYRQMMMCVKSRVSRSNGILWIRPDRTAIESHGPAARQGIRMLHQVRKVRSLVLK